MFGASVPEASVDENGHPGPMKTMSGSVRPFCGRARTRSPCQPSPEISDTVHRCGGYPNRLHVQGITLEAPEILSQCLLANPEKAPEATPHNQLGAVITRGVSSVA